MSPKTARLAIAYLAMVEADAICQADYDRELTTEEREQAGHLRTLAEENRHGTRKEQKLAHDWIHAKMQQLELF